MELQFREIEPFAKWLSDQNVKYTLYVLNQDGCTCNTVVAIPPLEMTPAQVGVLTEDGGIIFRKKRDVVKLVEDLLKKITFDKIIYTDISSEYKIIEEFHKDVVAYEWKQKQEKKDKFLSDIVSKASNSSTIIEIREQINDFYEEQHGKTETPHR